MALRIALFRGINVGGKNRVPMKPLAALFTAAGCTDVKTIIQSGNVVFRTPGAADGGMLQDIETGIERQFGFLPQILYLEPGELQDAMTACPFQGSAEGPQVLHLWFAHELPRNADLAGIEAARAATECCELRGRVFYLHAPDGIGRSKLAASVERLLGVPVTARNWRTLTRIAALANNELR